MMDKRLITIDNRLRKLGIGAFFCSSDLALNSMNLDRIEKLLNIIDDQKVVIEGFSKEFLSSKCPSKDSE